MTPPMDMTALGGRAAPIDAADPVRLRAIWRAKIDNLRLSFKEYDEGVIAPKSLPYKAIIELTQNCNFRCVMCPQSWEERFRVYHPEYNMPMETFVKVGNELFPLATFIDLRGFGESTILPYWPDIVDYLEGFPFIEWHLVTNLSLPRDATWDKMMKLGFTLGFSCDGATAETFEAIRVRSRFDRIRHNLGIVTEASRRYDRGLIYFISTIQRRNLHELRAIVEMAAEFGVPEVQFKVVQGPTPDIELPGAPREQIRENVDAAIAAGIDLDVRVTFNDPVFLRDADSERAARVSRYRNRTGQLPLPHCPPFDTEYWAQVGMDDYLKRAFDTHQVSVHKKCFKPMSYTYINYLGDMGTCNHMMYPNMAVMGNLTHESLSKVWLGPRYQAFRRSLLQNAPTDPRCQWCFENRLDD